MAEYAERDIRALDRQGNYYSRHISAMTGEKLHSKSDIAAELAWRDARIDELTAHAERLNAKLGEIQDALYGQGLQVAGWHLNGDNEPLDNWFEEHDWEPEPVQESSLDRQRLLWQAKAVEAAAEQISLSGGANRIRERLLRRANRLREQAEALK